MRKQMKVMREHLAEEDNDLDVYESKVHWLNLLGKDFISSQVIAQI